jgi:membrane protein YdbS with pleckstrin-like domain
MQKEKIINMAWVLILIPVVMTIYGAVKATMQPDISSVAKGISIHLVLIVFLIAIPGIIAKKLK